MQKCNTNTKLSKFCIYIQLQSHMLIVWLVTHHIFVMTAPAIQRELLTLATGLLLREIRIHLTDLQLFNPTQNLNAHKKA